MYKNETTIAIIADESFGDTWIYSYEQYLARVPYTDIHECFPQENVDDDDIARSIELYDLSDNDDKEKFLDNHRIAAIKSIASDKLVSIINTYFSEEEQCDEECSGYLEFANSGKQQFNVRLPLYTLQQIGLIAQKRGVTKTMVVIMAIDMLSSASHKP